MSQPHAKVLVLTTSVSQSLAVFKKLKRTAKKEGRTDLTFFAGRHRVDGNEGQRLHFYAVRSVEETWLELAGLQCTNIVYSTMLRHQLVLLDALRTRMRDAHFKGFWTIEPLFDEDATRHVMDRIMRAKKETD